jgi:archaeosine synthase beta-subunit
VRLAYQKIDPVSEALKSNCYEEEKVIKPAFYRISPVNINGIPSNRLMVVIKTSGCEFSPKIDGCSLCGFVENTGNGLTDEDIVEQLDWVLRSNDLTDVEEIDILTLGSFFNDNAINQNTRLALLEKAAERVQVKRVSVESRAEYVTIDKIQQCQTRLNGKILEFGIGLESADDYIRNEIIKKNLLKKDFMDTVRKVKAANGHLVTYLLIKPPHLSERAAIEDAIKSVKFVFQTAMTFDIPARVAFEPVFICKDTNLEQMYLSSNYNLVNLWSIIEVIIRTYQYGNIYVGLCDETLTYKRMPHSFPHCYKNIVQEIEGFNKTQDITSLLQLDCHCRSHYRDQMIRGEI